MTPNPVCFARFITASCVFHSASFTWFIHFLCDNRYNHNCAPVPSTHAVCSPWCVLVVHNTRWLAVKASMYLQAPWLMPLLLFLGKVQSFECDVFFSLCVGYIVIQTPWITISCEVYIYVKVNSEARQWGGSQSPIHGSHNQVIDFHCLCVSSMGNEWFMFSPLTKFIVTWLTSHDCWVVWKRSKVPNRATVSSVPHHSQVCDMIEE